MFKSSKYLKSKNINILIILIDKSSHPEVFLEKDVLKICSKFTGEHPCRSAISIKLQSNFTEITLRHGCSHVNMLHIFRTPVPKNTSGSLLPTRPFWLLAYQNQSTRGIFLNPPFVLYSVNSFLPHIFL